MYPKEEWFYTQDKLANYSEAYVISPNATIQHRQLHMWLYLIVLNQWLDLA